jgi:hypothetical protein
MAPPGVPVELSPRRIVAPPIGPPYLALPFPLGVP